MDDQEFDDAVSELATVIPKFKNIDRQEFYDFLSELINDFDNAST